MGVIAIGAAGGLHASSPETLLDALAKIESALREVVTNFSAVKDYQDHWLKTQLHRSLELGLAEESEEGRGQRAEGRREQCGRGFNLRLRCANNPLPIASHQI